MATIIVKHLTVLVSSRNGVMEGLKERKYYGTADRTANVGNGSSSSSTLSLFTWSVDDSSNRYHQEKNLGANWNQTDVKCLTPPNMITTASVSHFIYVKTIIIIFTDTGTSFMVPNMIRQRLVSCNSNHILLDNKMTDDEMMSYIYFMKRRVFIPIDTPRGVVSIQKYNE